MQSNVSPRHLRMGYMTCVRVNFPGSIGSFWNVTDQEQREKVLSRKITCLMSIISFSALTFEKREVLSYPKSRLNNCSTENVSTPLCLIQFMNIPAYTKVIQVHTNFYPEHPLPTSTYPSCTLCYSFMAYALTPWIN